MLRTKLYHLSFDGNLPGTLHPRQPYGTDEARAKGAIGEFLPDRISFAPTVEQCFVGIYPNIADIVEREGSFTIYLYEGDWDENTTYIDHETMVKEVWDYPITSEICITSPISIRKVGKIEIIISNDPRKGYYLNRLKKDGTFTSYLSNIAPGIIWNFVEEEFDKQDIINKVTSLKEELGDDVEIIVDFGAAIVMHGVKETTHDIDIHVVCDLHNFMRVVGDNETRFRNGKTIINRGDFEIAMLDKERDTIFIDGLEVMSISSLRNTYKNMYLKTGRSKDKETLTLLSK